MFYARKGSIEPRRAPSRKRVGTVGHVLLLVSLLLRLFFELASADKPAGDALPDTSKHGFTDHTLT